MANDVAVELFYAGAWNAAPPYNRDAITITRGRGGEAGAARPQSARLTLDNRSGTYNPRNPDSPLSPTVAFAETFATPVVDGWGPGWSIGGVGGTLLASDFAVSAGRARHFVPTDNAFRFSYRASELYADVGVTVEVDTVLGLVAGGAIEPGNILLRGQSTSNYYMARVSIDAAEVMTVQLFHSTGGAISPAVVVPDLVWTGQPFMMSAWIEGSHLAAKVWDPAVGGEPAGWHVTATDTTITAAGWIGVRSGVAFGNTNTKPVEFSYDNLTVTLPRVAGRNTPTRVRVQLAADTFDRPAVANDWGTSTSGQVWTRLGGSAADYSTTGTLGRITIPTGETASRSVLLPDTYSDIEVRPTVKVGGVAVGAPRNAYVRFRHVDASNYYRLQLSFDTAGTVDVTLAKVIAGSVTSLDSVANHVGYSAGSEVHVFVSAYGSALKAKVWTGATEPHAWTVEAVDTTYTSGRVGLMSALTAGNTNTNPTTDFDNLTVGWSRFHGEAASWKPRRSIDFDALSGRGDAWTEFEAAGVLRRVGQGTQPALSPFHRTITSAATIDNLLAYWPCEDDANARQAASALPGGTAMVATTAVDFAASGTSFARNLTAIGFGRLVDPGTAPLPNLAAGGKLTGAVPAGRSSPIEWAVCFVARCNALGAAEDIVIAEWSTPGGTYAFWEVLQDGAGLGTEVAVYNAARTVRTVILSTVDSEIILTEYRVEAEQSGTAIDVRFYADGNLKDSFNGAANTLARVTQAEGNPASNVVAGSVGFYVGHIQAWDTATPPSLGFSLFGQPTQVLDSAGVAIYPWYRWLNERCADRLARLNVERGVPLQLVGTAADTIRMGAQPDAAFTTLTGEVERTDDGLLFEPRDTPGLAYRTRASLMFQAPALTLDFAAGGEVAPPLDPDTDDRGTRNDVTVKNAGGSSYPAVQSFGPLSVDAVGRTATTVAVSMALDSDLPELGDWLLAKGTVDAARYPQITVDLDGHPELAAAASAVDIGDVIRLTNSEDGTVDLLVLGYAELLGSHRRKVTFNCVPAAPYRPLP